MSHQILDTILTACDKLSTFNWVLVYVLMYVKVLQPGLVYGTCSKHSINLQLISLTYISYCIYCKRQLLLDNTSQSQYLSSTAHARVVLSILLTPRYVLVVCSPDQAELPYVSLFFTCHRTFVITCILFICSINVSSFLHSTVSSKFNTKLSCRRETA